MSLSILDEVFWAGGFVGHLVLAAVLLRYERWRTFPIFTALICFQLGRTCVLFTVFHFGTSHGYFQCYWILALADYIFQIGLLLEIGRAVLPRLSFSNRKSQRRSLWFLMTGILLIAALCLAISPPGSVGLDLWDERINLFTSLLTCWLYVVISLRTTRLSLRWDDHVMALGQGLALWASAAVLGDLTHACFGFGPHVSILDQSRMLIYVGTLAYWSWALAKPANSNAPGSALEHLIAHYGQTH